MIKAPGFKIKVGEGEPIESAEGVISYIQNRLWPDQPESGRGMVQLFGRLSEIMIARFNQVPEKHFLAFLNDAGVSLLPPRAASGEVTFTPAKDAPPLIRVPEGTQLATLQTKTNPEIIFETQRDLNVANNRLIMCVAVDPLNYSEYTTQAIGLTPCSATGFPAFRGDNERKRIFYLGGAELFDFPDDTSRLASRFDIKIKFAIPGSPAADGGWKLNWLYYDGTLPWKPLSQEGEEWQVWDGTADFSRSGDDGGEGPNVILRRLPKFAATTEVDGTDGKWLACELTGGSARDHLPVIDDIAVARTIQLSQVSIPINNVFSAMQSGTLLMPLDANHEFLPFGIHPARLDTFYLRADDALSKPGTQVTLKINLQGKPHGVDLESEPIVEWEYFSADGWKIIQGVDENLTRTGNVTVQFHLPANGVVKTKVNSLEGYWIRARLTGGNYSAAGCGLLPIGNAGALKWVEPQSFAPLIKRLTITCDSYSETELKPVCYTSVDGKLRRQELASTAAHPFSPFRVDVEDAALYLGFSHAFPVREWVQILLDVAENGKSGNEPIPILWEYWNGTQWNSLKAADGTRGLTERGYLGFFGPDDHQASIEFGQNAHWIRVTPHDPPVAKAGEDQNVRTAAGTTLANVTLDASRSRGLGVRAGTARYRWRLVSSHPIAHARTETRISTFNDQAVVRLDASHSQGISGASPAGSWKFIWRQVSSHPPVADAGSDQRVWTPIKETLVNLDASGSHARGGENIVKYIWRKIEAESKTGFKMPYLKKIRTNTVPVTNAITLRAEQLGSSNGEPSQIFNLKRTPVLPGIQVAVREPDLPSAVQLGQLEQELKQDDIQAQAVLSDPSIPGEGIWTRWRQVSDFYQSNPDSRHFVLDPILGQVRFGDGKQGKIPPIGNGNIQAVVYQSHSGAGGNLGGGTITVLRNPTGDLANIKTLTNHEATAGGSDAETVDDVKQRGPQTLKHHQRAVTLEDFVWLARESSSEVARAYCLPACNPLGLPEAGWVTVVITPQSQEAKPYPGPALVRYVQAYMEERTLANLGLLNHVHVKGPEYIRATVVAKVVPTVPEKADEVKLAVLKQLESFLHPLYGGPDRTGWALGRDVYLSEISSEIESVPGVDHLVDISLSGSLQQFRVYLTPGLESPIYVPLGSKVCTFDERYMFHLAGSKIADSLDVYGFKVGDMVDLVTANNRVIKEGLEIASLSHTGEVIVFSESFHSIQGDALLSADRRLRLPLSETMLNSNGQVIGVTVEGFEPDARDVCVVTGEHRDTRLEFLTVKAIETCHDRIFIPEGHLVYSGSHDIQMITEKEYANPAAEPG